ncbi:MAG: VacJ family lipoprotein [Anaerobiospirillum succiniciproducens]|uniref:MlaA family lipoprotein n=1 Tax=Anaerobiospirillum succiniciproducens TaxID=13335 RepID=UPI0026DB63A1|nr:VacJ family lipoprotein [Anaerobiospirillum succiniciproducens]MDO4676029.1 VacJ family lipoprotein [Anaerobiospirillum succiniciproducens]
MFNLKRHVKQVFGSSMLCAALMLSTVGLTTEAQAAHGAYNPMMPRQLSEKAASADYTYGYSVLSGHAIDTLEGPNRYMWYLNYDILDKYILRPVSHGYAYLPQGVQNSVGNFFNNLDEINNVPNNLLVGEFASSGTSLVRLAINSTIGILGFFDVASYIGIKHTPMNMATVLGKGKVEQGPFMMIPAYGPTTARDLHGDIIDGLPWYAVSWPITTAKFVIRGIHNRAQLIDQEPVLDNSIDPYIFTRDAYLMYDENKVNPIQEGEVTDTDDFDDEFLDEIDG